jgi:hypothetical protein
MSLPWYVTLCLFLLAPVYTILVRDKLWPRLQDWWASRSQNKIQERITKLEQRLSEAEKLTPHTQVEYMLFFGLEQICFLVPFGVHLIFSALVAPLMLFKPPLLSEYNMITLQLIFLSVILINGLILIGTTYHWRSYRLPRSEEWRESTRKEIAALRSKLK